jgi:uncharacterized protein YjdB
MKNFMKLVLLTIVFAITQSTMFAQTIDSVSVHPTSCDKNGYPLGTVYVFASGAQSYELFRDGILIQSMQKTGYSQKFDSLIVDPSFGFSYSVVALGSGSQSKTISYPSTWPVKLDLSVSLSSQSICLGNTVVLTANTNATELLWSTSDVSAIITKTPQYNTNYTLTVKNNDGCSATTNAYVTVFSVPYVDLGIDQTVCAGTIQTFEATVNMDSYIWSSGETTQSILKTTAGKYFVTVTKNGCSAFDSVSLNVNSLPTATITPQNQGICYGKSGNLTLSTNAKYFNWSTGETTQNISASPSVNTAYFVTVTSSDGCTNTAFAAINVSPSPTVTISQTQTAICQGNSVNLTAATAAFYKWSTSETSAVISKTPTATTTYTVTGTNPMGCTSIASAVVTVNQKPVVTIAASPNTSICQGTQVTLTPTGGTTYIWNDGQQTTTSVKYSPSVQTTYSLTATSSQGCIGTASIIISISSPTITVTATPDSITSGSSTVISASGGNTYSWDNGATYITTNSKTFTPSASIIYSVKGKDVNSCIGNGSVKVIVDGKSISQISSIIVHDTTVVIGTPCLLKPIILPTDASNKTLTWSTNNGGLATITSDGIVSGLQAGDCGIQYSAIDGSGISGSLIVHIVTSILPTSISLTPITLQNVNVGSTVTFTATVTPSNATDKTIVWSSSDTSVAIVNAGIVTAKKVGSSTISASSKVATTIKSSILLNVTNSIVVDSVLALSSAINTGGDSLKIMFGKPITKSSFVSSDFTLTVNGINVTVQSISIDYNCPNLVWFYIGNGKINSRADNIQLAYKPGSLKSTDTIPVKRFTFTVPTNYFQSACYTIETFDILTNTWTTWAPGISNVTGIDPVGTSKVGKFTKAYSTTLSNQYVAFKADLPAVLTSDSTLNTRLLYNQIFKMRMYVNKSNAKVRLRLQDKYLGTNAWTTSIEQVITIANPNVWNFVSFDFSSQLPSNTNFNEIQIDIEPEIATTVDETLYVDDIQLCSFIPTIKLVNGNTTVDGSQIKLNFSLPVTLPQSTNSFSVYVNGVSQTVSSIKWDNNNTSSLILTLLKPVVSTDVITLSYSGFGGINGLSGPSLPSFYNTPITNQTNTVNVTAINVIPNTSSVNVGSNITLSANVTPTTASQLVTWISSNTSIATVSPLGVVTGLAGGNVIITAISTANPVYTATCSVSVIAEGIAVSSIIVSLSSNSILIGNTSTATFTINPSTATDKTVTWSSSDPTVASVSSTGIVTGIKSGTANIIATSVYTPTVNGSQILTVTQQTIPVTGVTLNMINMNINVNQQNVPLTATVMPANASNIAIKWRSSDSTVATVTQLGLVTGLKVGSCLITASSQADPTKLASCTVTVYQSTTTTKTVLTMKIQDAQSLYTISTEGIATGQYPVGSKAILQSAINSAILINQNTTSTQAQIDQAVADLTSAVTTFQSKSITVDKVALQNSLLVAQTLISNAIVGTQSGNYPQTAKDNFQIAITTAQMVMSSIVTTQAQVDQAVVDLNSAIAIFKASQIEIIKIPVTGMKILDGSQNLQVGQSFIFHAQTIPMNATSQQVIWYYINANNTSDKGTLGKGSALTVTPQNAGIYWIYAFSNEYKISGKDTVWFHDSINVVVIQHIAVSQVFANISGTMKVLVGATDISASAYVYPSTATNKAVTWTTSNASIAIVDQNGVIEGIAKGSVNIVVASVEDPTKFATFIVDVVEPTVDKSQLKGAIEYSDYIISYITPNQLGTNAGQYSATLMAALKDQNTSSKIVLNASNSTQIEVALSTAALNKAIYDFKNSLVGAIDITSVTLNTSTINVAVTAAPYMLSVTILPSNATYKTLIWKSSDASIATVDQNGLVTFVGAGVAVITATTTDGTAITVNCSVIVSVPVESIYIPQTIGLKVGEIVPVTAFVLPLNSSNKLVNWTSSDSTIATVDANGMVTAISVGSAKIIAQSVDGQKTAVSIANVSAIDIAMTKITLPTSPLQMIVGESKSIEAIITPFNATNKTIFWKSSNMASLAVDYTGVVTAIGIDTVRVYAFNQDKTIIDSIEVFISASKAPEIIPIEPVVVKTGTSTITIALANLVLDDKTSLSNLTFVTSTDANFTITVIGDSLVITPKNVQTALTGTIKVVVVDQDNQSSTIDIPVTVSSAANTAPVLTSVPKQSMIVGGTLIPVTLSQYVKDDYTKPTDIIWTVATNSNLQASIAYGVLSVTPKLSSWIGTDSLLVTAADKDGLTKSMYIQFEVSNKTNEAPIFLQIPTQEQTSTLSFQPINLTKYVTDDYTSSSYIVWSVSKSNKLTVSIVNGKAYLTVIDKNWVGSEMLTFTATDQAGLSSQVSVVCNQKAVAIQNTWTGKPEVSFVAERTTVGVNEQVYFHGSITGVANDGYEWTFVGANSTTSNDLNPTVKYPKVGKYDVLFVAGNNGLIDSSEVKIYVNVIGITSPDTTICKGSAITLSVSDKSLMKYTWSNGATTASITVTPTANTKYSVIAQSGLFKYYDTVLVSISKPVSLGNDTAICAGSSVQYSLNSYSTYKWNNNNALTSNTFTASSAQTVTVETKDAFNCVSTASAQITINALPTVELGANDSICPLSPKVLDAGSGLASYKWSNGISTQTISVSSSAIYVVTVTNANGCKNTDAVTVVVKQPYAEQLGVATVLGSNKIVLAWNRSLNKNIKIYTVLRESTKAGVFDIIGTRQFSDTSYIVDNSASPLSQTYTYKLQTTDNCLDTISSKKHVTMLLQAVYSESTTANQLYWNGYEGVVLSTYNIYRNGKRIKSLAASSGNNSYTYNDIDGIKGDLYQIRYDLPDSIFTTQLKSDSGPFSQSLSNLAESELTGSSITSENTVIVYPNPAEGEITVSLGNADNAKLEIITVEGQVVFAKTNVNESSINLSVEKLTAGVYFIKTTLIDRVVLTQFIKL